MTGTPISKIGSLLFIVLFMGSLLGVFLAWGQFKFSDSDFPYRGLLTGTYLQVRREMFRERVFDKTLIGKERWLIYTAEGSIDDFQHINAFTESELQRLQKALDALHADLRQRGITFLVVIPPNKNTIYPEYVPAEIPVVNAPSRYDQLVEYMQRHGTTPLLDLRPALLEARKTRVVYYSKDTHWNDLGAFVAYQEILMALQPEYPILEPHVISEFTQTTRAGVTLDLARTLSAPDLVTDDIVLSPLYTSNTTFTQTKYDYRRLTIAVNPDTALPKAVIYHDSFLNPLIPWLGDHFEKAIFIPVNTPPEIWNFTWITTERPEIVILEFTERYIDQIPLYVDLAWR